MWQEWVNAVLGLAVLGVAVFGGLEASMAWTFGVIGALVAIIGFWGAISLPESTAGRA